MLRNVVRLFSVLVLLSLLSASVAAASSPVLDIYMFHSETCPHCKRVIAEILPGIQKKYGDRINLRLFEINDPVNFKLTLVMEKLYGVTEEEAGVPEIFFARVVLIGENSIRDNFDTEIQKSLDSGKYLKLPTPDQLLAMIVEPTPGAGQPVTGTAALSSTVPLTSTTSLTASQSSPSSTLPTAAPTVTATVTVTSTSPLTPTVALTTTAPATGTAAAGASLAPSDGKPIHLAYFYKPGCKECDRAQYELNYVKSQYPNLVVDSFDIIENAALNAWLGEKYGVPEAERVTSPAVFVGQDHLTQKDVNAAGLQRIVAKYNGAGAEATWTQWQESAAPDKVLGIFQHISLAAVVGSGLVDGLNPCAFATIIFFVAYLAFIGRKGRDVLLTGLAFTLGVFIAYFLLGVGLLRVLEAVNMTKLGRWLYIVIAALCLILAVVNFTDFFKAREGKPEEMQMRLPMRMRRWINKIIREGAPVRAYALVALLTGFVVSVIELACTGQIYIVVLSALSQPALRTQALGYLLIYNLAFIVPLIIVFLLAFFGVSSERFSLVLQRHTATVKLCTALLFLGLGLWLFYSFLPLFGVRLLGG
jgi:cytochrome c biogenesis protein CcdA/thiol-disulfide isomerase/thioredoxin